MKDRPKTIDHLFMPGETVVAAIKKYNFYDVTNDEMKILLEQFKHCNTDLQIPRPGMAVLIPILARHQERAFCKKTQ
jgi:hypothetical protein